MGSMDQKIMDQKIKKKLESFFSKHKLLKYRKKELLIRADDSPLGIFYLQEGLIRQYTISKNGEELTLNIYKPPSLFPLAYAINDTLPAHHYEAIIPSVLFRAPKEDVLQFIKKEPEILIDLISRIYKGLEGVFKRIENLMAGSAKARLITELVIYAKRFGLKHDDGLLIDLSLTHEALAEQSGLSRETVGRLLKDLKEKSVINLKSRKILVKDLKELEKELQSLG